MSFHSLPSCGRQQPSAWVRVWKRSSVIGAPHAPTCCTARRRRPETLLDSSSSSGSRLIPDLRVRVSTMPFQPYASYFKPEELDTLTAAFNDTLQELRASGIDLSSEDKVALVKRKLAQRILVSATAGGVRDVETLKKQALRSLSGGVRPGGEQTFASEAA